MAHLSVTTTAVEVPVLGEGVLVLQNHGTGMIFFDHDPNVTTATGMELTVGSSYEYPKAGEGGVFVISDSTADLRYIHI